MRSGWPHCDVRPRRAGPLLLECSAGSSSTGSARRRASGGREAVAFPHGEPCPMRARRVSFADRPDDLVEVTVRRPPVLEAGIRRATRSTTGYPFGTSTPTVHPVPRHAPSIHPAGSPVTAGVTWSPKSTCDARALSPDRRPGIASLAFDHDARLRRCLCPCRDAVRRRGRGRCRHPHHGIEHVLDAGVQGIVSCGTTGEYYALSEAERIDVMRHTYEVVAGRAQLVAGCNRVPRGWRSSSPAPPSTSATTR